MSWKDLVGEVLSSLGESIKESYNNGTMGDNFYRAAIDVKKQHGKFDEAAIFEDRLESRISKRREKERIERENKRNSDY